MRVFLYSRISTDKQDLIQQRERVQNYIESRGWTITKEIYDEDVSGYKVSYKDRGLAKLIDMMQEGDCLICSELSRLGRKMFDINRLINEDLKPRKLRLVIVSMGIDLDCSKMKAIDELIIQNFAFAAQVEAEMTSDRTKSSLSAIKKKIAETGSHVSKRGNVITHLGRPKNCESDPKAIKAMAAARTEKARNNPFNIQFNKYLMMFENRCGKIKDAQAISAFVQELAQLDFRTATGLPFDIPRCWQMIYKARKLFA